MEPIMKDGLIRRDRDKDRHKGENKPIIKAVIIYDDGFSLITCERGGVYSLSNFFPPVP